MAIATLEVGILIVATIEQFAVADTLIVEKILASNGYPIEFWRVRELSFELRFEVRT